MENFFDPLTIVGIFVSFVLGLSLSLFFTAKKTEKWAKVVGVTLLSVILGFTVIKIFEIWTSVKIFPKSLNYVKSLESFANMPDTPFKKVVQEELSYIDDTLKQIIDHRIQLSREEIISRWEILVKSSNKFIDATNIVSLDDWNKLAPKNGQEVQEYIIKKGVRIRRIFIYDAFDPNHEQGLIELAKSQKKIGVYVRKISLQQINKNPQLKEFIGKLGTVDIALFDNKTLLLTNVDEKKRMISAVVTSDRHQIRIAKQFFSKLWQFANDI